MVYVKLEAGNHGLTEPRGMDKILTQFLEAAGLEGNFEVRLRGCSKGTPHRQGLENIDVRPPDQGGSAINIRAQPGSNDTSREMGLLVPAEWDPDELFELLRATAERLEQAAPERNGGDVHEHIVQLCQMMPMEKFSTKGLTAEMAGVLRLDGVPALQKSLKDLADRGKYLIPMGGDVFHWMGDIWDEAHPPAPELNDSFEDSPEDEEDSDACDTGAAQINIAEWGKQFIEQLPPGRMNRIRRLQVVYKMMGGKSFTLDDPRIVSKDLPEQVRHFGMAPNSVQPFLWKLVNDAEYHVVDGEPLLSVEERENGNIYHWQANPRDYLPSSLSKREEKEAPMRPSSDIANELREKQARQAECATEVAVLHDRINNLENEQLALWEAIEHLKNDLETARKVERLAGLEKIAKLMEERGFSAADLEQLSKMLPQR